MAIRRRLILSKTIGAAVLTGGVVMLVGCRVVSIEQDLEARERRSESFDAREHVAKIWQSRVVPSLEKSAINVADLPVAGLDGFGKKHGRKAGEGSPWTFVMRGEGTVASIDRASRQGGIALNGVGLREVMLQTGPVITESTVRDALPMFDFNDFVDQVAYAEVSRALNSKALAGVAPAAAGLTPGRRVRFLGVAHVFPEGGSLRVLPVRIEAAD